jgi:hypothetical protein
MRKNYNIFSSKPNERGGRGEDVMSKLQAFSKYNTFWSFKALEF